MVYVLNNGQPGFTIMGPNLTLTVGRDDFYGSTTDEGVRALQSNNKLVNHGVIWSATSDGVKFAGGATLNNEASGVILGKEGGVNIVGGALVNRGVIKGYDVYGVVVPGGLGAKIVNTGEIFGGAWGVYDSGGNVTLENAGVIRADNTAVNSNGGVTTKILNKKGGTIAGPQAIRMESDAKLVLDNKGAISGNIACANDKALVDLIVNRGTIAGNIGLGAGNDSFVFAGGKQGIVSGQGGADRFHFKQKLVTGKDAAKIGDMTPGTDLMVLSKKLFKGIGKEGVLKDKYFQAGKKAKDKDDRIVWDVNSGGVSFDKDGKGGAKQKLFAVLDPGIDLKASDFLVSA